MTTEPDGTTMLDDPGEQIDERADEEQPAGDAPDDDYEVVDDAAAASPKYIFDLNDGYAAMDSAPDRVREIYSPLTDDERIELGARMTANVLEIERRQSLHKGIKLLQEKVEEFAHDLNTGSKLRSVECRVVLNCPESGKKTIYRTDTMEIVETVYMEPQDSQLTLPLVDGDGTGEALGEVSGEEQTGAPILTFASGPDGEPVVAEAGDAEAGEGTSPYYRGRVARYDGKLETDNPYSSISETVAFEEWESGWNDGVENPLTLPPANDEPEESIADKARVLKEGKA